jgi:predicted MFS family arabinose efflux permease
MRIAKPLLLVTTPIGLAIGLYEGWRLAGGLVFIMGALMLVIAAAFGSVVWTIRKERAEEEERKKAAAAVESPTPPDAAT